jgi:hypothetical protein
MTTLSREEENLFYSVLNPLLVYGNQVLHIHDGLDSVERLKELDLLEALELSTAVLGKRDLLNEYADKNPAGFPKEGLDVVRNWTHALPGTFYIMEHRSEHSVFFDSERRLILGVVGIQSELADMMPFTPIIVDTVLLPIKNKITYHGVIAPYRVTLGSGILRGLEEEFSTVMAESGVLTTLPAEAMGHAVDH